MNTLLECKEIKWVLWMHWDTWYKVCRCKRRELRVTIKVWRRSSCIDFRLKYVSRCVIQVETSFKRQHECKMKWHFSDRRGEISNIFHASEHNLSSHWRREETRLLEERTWTRVTGGGKEKKERRRLREWCTERSVNSLSEEREKLSVRVVYKTGMMFSVF